MPTGLSFDSRVLDHDTGPDHPEKPQRVSVAAKALDGSVWRKELVDIAAFKVQHTWLETVHTREYIDRAAAACRDGLPFLDSMDVAISSRSFDVARLAVGASLALADALFAGRIDNGFALTRPPGHHAESSAALGFCVFNNVAVLARYLQQHHGVEKVAIVDWDVHHGNGTQHTFESDPSVMYVSTHQYPFYPGSGAAHECGEGRGKGSVVNCPMPAGASDSAYERAFMETILPALDGFAPDIVLISAGFDAHRNDPLAEIELSNSAFRWMSRRVLEVAEKHANGRAISLLEGGYNLNHLGECVAIHVDELRRASASNPHEAGASTL